MTLTSHTLSVAKLPQDQGEEAITSDHANGLYREFASHSTALVNYKLSKQESRRACSQILPC